MASIERYLHPWALSKPDYACPATEGRWAMGLLTAYKNNIQIPHHNTQLLLRDASSITGEIIQKPYSDQYGYPTWLVLTGPCAGFILTPHKLRLLRPLLCVPKKDFEDNGFLLTDELQNELKQERILTEGPGWYMSFVINLLRKTVNIPPDENTLWNNSLEFQRLETDWLEMLQRGKEIRLESIDKRT
jgi:hypothetical protein